MKSFNSLSDATFTDSFTRPFARTSTHNFTHRFARPFSRAEKSKGYIAVMDSGVGGLSVLGSLVRALPQENFLYFGDNENAPYGNRTESDLLSLTLKNLNYLLSFGVKAIVVACNTLSATLTHDIELYSGVKTFGVYPPVFSHLFRGEKTLLIATPFTCKSYKALRGLYVAETGGLAKSVEENVFNLNNINIARELESSRLYYCAEKPDKNGAPLLTSFDHEERFDTVILGCTHYLFVKNKIIDHLRPKITESGNENTVKAVKEFFGHGKSQVFKRENGVLFIGKYADFNEKVFREVVIKPQNLLEKN